MQDINNSSLEIELYPFDNNRFSSLCGKLDENIKRIEKYFRVDIYSRENLLKIKGEQRAVKSVGIILKELYEICLLYTSPSPRDKRQSRMPSSA